MRQRRNNNHPQKTGYRTLGGEPILVPQELELHFKADNLFTQTRWARKIKAVGGRYSSERGAYHAGERLIWLPTTDEGRQLATLLIKTYAPVGAEVVVIARKTGADAGTAAVVGVKRDDPHPIESFFQHFNENLELHCKRDLLARDVPGDQAEEQIRLAKAAKSSLSEIRGSISKVTRVLGMTEEDVLQQNTADLFMKLEELAAHAPENGGPGHEPKSRKRPSA